MASLNFMPTESASVETVDERSALRAITLHRTSAIEAGRARGICVIKNLSTGGAMIQTSIALMPGNPLVLIMTSGKRIAGRVRWVQDNRVGIQFDTDIVLSAVLDRGEGDGVPVRRMPRLTLSVPARVTDALGTKLATTCDISTHGARLACDNEILTGPVTIKLPHLPSIAARVLWTTSGQSGCVFNRPFAIDEVTDWINGIE